MKRQIHKNRSSLPEVGGFLRLSLLSALAMALAAAGIQPAAAMMHDVRRSLGLRDR